MSLIPELLLPNKSSPMLPAMQLLIDEFYNLEDFDGDGLIYGYDFYIAGSDLPGPLKSLNDNEFWSPPKNYVKSWDDFMKNGTNNLVSK